MKNYNGWTNWDTWNANLWLTNDETVYKCCLMCQDKGGLSGIFEQFYGRDHDGINWDDINWGEIFESIN
jgi:hypothetical protein